MFQSINQKRARLQITNDCAKGAYNSNGQQLQGRQGSSHTTPYKIGILAFAMLLAAPTASAFNLRIVGGAETTIEQFPYMSALVNRGADASDTFCGASVIHPRWVMTAAHCVEGVAASSLDVLTGVDNLQRASEGERISVKRIINHPAYDTNNVSSDIALLELDAPTRAPAVSVASNQNAALFATGQPVAVAGWGDRSDGNGDYPIQLHAIDLSISDFTRCSQAYSGLTSVHLCAGVPDGSRDSCSGDSGGPLVARTDSGVFQVGIVSFGESCASVTHPGVYTRVSEFSDFIAQHVDNFTPAGMDSNAIVSEVNPPADVPAASPTAVVNEFDPGDESTVAPENMIVDGDLADLEQLPDSASADQTDVVETDYHTDGVAVFDNAAGLELTQLDAYAYELDENQVSVLVEVYNTGDTEVVLSTPQVEGTVSILVEADACTQSPLQPGDFCDLEIIWDRTEGDLEANLAVNAFDGIEDRRVSLELQATVLEPAAFSEALDYSAEYFTDDLDLWDEYEPLATQGSTSLTAEFTEDEDGFLLAEFDNDEGDTLDFMYQLEHADCVISINDEERFFLSASNEWQQASIELPLNARVSWYCKPIADYPMRDQDSPSSDQRATRVSFDGFSLRQGGDAASADSGAQVDIGADGIANTENESSANLALESGSGGGSLGVGLLVLLLSAASRTRRVASLKVAASSHDASSADLKTLPEDPGRV